VNSEVCSTTASQDLYKAFDSSIGQAADSVKKTRVSIQYSRLGTDSLGQDHISPKFLGLLLELICVHERMLSMILGSPGWNHMLRLLSV